MDDMNQQAEHPSIGLESCHLLLQAPLSISDQLFGDSKYVPF